MKVYVAGLLLLSIGWASAEPPALFRKGAHVRAGGIVGQEQQDGDDEGPAQAADPAGREIIELADGTLLHGALEQIDTVHGQILWRRDDASEPIAFSTADVSRLVIEERGTPKSGRATVKLAGGNWFTGAMVEMRDGIAKFEIAGGLPISVNRARIEWIYFSDGPSAVDCYDGPTSGAGWATGASWTFHNGALRASSPNVVSHKFDALPDKVDYEVELDQGMVEPAFKLVLHSRTAEVSQESSGSVELLFMGNSLQMVAAIDKAMQVQQTPMPDDDFNYHGAYDALAAETSSKARPFHVRLLEDRPAGRLIIYMNGRRAADWPIGKAKVGANRGAIGVQPLGWSSGAEQVLPIVRVTPWDGQAPLEATPLDDPDDRMSDEVLRRDGAIERAPIRAVDATSLVLDRDQRSEFARADLALLRFRRPSDPSEEIPPAARVHLAPKGEVDVDSITFKDGKFVLQTGFAGEFAVGPDSIRSIDLALPKAAGDATEGKDELVFRNGDRLRGTLLVAGDSRKLRWRIAKSGSTADFDTGRIAGVLLGETVAPGEEGAVAGDGVGAATVIRFRNGDLLEGSAVRLDGTHLTVETAITGPLEIPRADVRTIYFPDNGKRRIYDPASNPAECEGPQVTAAQAANPRPGLKKRKRTEPWRYFNGAFTLGGTGPRNGALHLGQTFAAMPNEMEFDFDASSPKAPVMLAAQLFMGEQAAGYFLQIAPTSLYIYDMQPRQRMGRVAQQQFEFPPKLRNSDRERHFRLFVNRYSGKLTIYIDGALIGHFNAKMNAPARKLEGHTIQLTPQPGSACTFLNIWIGPWNGQLPGSPLASGESRLDSVLLANGDCSSGVVRAIGERAVSLDCELGEVEFPVPRAAVVEFGNAAALHPLRAATHCRLRFAGLGSLTARKYEIRDDSIMLDSELAGSLKLPLTSLRELVFESAAPDSPADSPQAPPVPPAKEESVPIPKKPRVIVY